MIAPALHSLAARLAPAVFSLALAAGLVSLAPGTAAAATVDFVIDTDASSVTVTDTGSGLVCTLTHCGIEASLAVTDGQTVTVAEGATESFDFLTWTGTGTGLTTFTVEAVLAFSAPAGSADGTGQGGAFLVTGHIVGGVLSWTSVTSSFPTGIDATVAYEGGAGLFLGTSVTTGASITLNSVTPAPVPLPAGGLLLVAALGGTALLRRRMAA